MHLETWQWVLGGAAALFVGISKTGVPGMGILVVPLLAAVFGGRPSVGIMLPMLVVGDVFAVLWYRRHAEWDKLIKLAPWVAVGIGAGAVALQVLGHVKQDKDILNPVIGGLVLAMLIVYVLQGQLGQRLTPKSGVGMAGTGVTAGFATTVSNAAGPVMQIYLAAHKMPKEQFMGTLAWYFFIINLCKVPIYAAISAANPENPMMTRHSLLFNLEVVPIIIIGVFVGKWLLPRISQRLFNDVVLVLAGVAAVKLIVG